MTATVAVLQFAGSLSVTVPDTVVEAHVGHRPRLLGENLAGQVDAIAMEQGLGYYPAIDFFRTGGAGVDAALLGAMDDAARFCTAYARREIQQRLGRVFTEVRIGRVQASAYNLPHVRPSREGAPGALAAHYAPNRVKAGVRLQMAGQDSSAEPEALARRYIARGVAEGFERVVIATLRRLTPD